MTKKKCDYEYEHDNLHIHKNKCEKCKYYLNCCYVKAIKNLENLEVNTDADSD